MSSVASVLNHEIITWTCMVGSYVCRGGTTKFVCARLFCPFFDFSDGLFVEETCFRLKGPKYIFFFCFHKPYYIVPTWYYFFRDFLCMEEEFRLEEGVCSLICSVIYYFCSLINFCWLVHFYSVNKTLKRTELQ